MNITVQYADTVEHFTNVKNIDYKNTLVNSPKMAIVYMKDSRELTEIFYMDELVNVHDTITGKIYYNKF